MCVEKVVLGVDMRQLKDAASDFIILALEGDAFNLEYIHSETRTYSRTWRTWILIQTMQMRRDFVLMGVFQCYSADLKNA